MKTNIHFWSYLSQSFLNEKCFRQACRENQNARFMSSNFFKKKSLPVWEKVEKYGTA
jgi:hypothetical protein